jgi:hypothetical protein
MIRRSLLILAFVMGLLPICEPEQRFLPTDCTSLVELLAPSHAEDSIAGRADLRDEGNRAAVPEQL